VSGEDDADGLPSDLRCDTAADRVLRHQPDRPPGPAFGCGAAHHRDNCRTLRTIEGRFGLATRLVGNGSLQTAGEVALPDAGRLSRKRAHGFRSRAYRQSLIEELKHADSTPRASGQRLAFALHRRELGAVLLAQFQASETLRGFHSLLRSEVDPGIKPNVITKRRSKD
jgi:hypothetical protein